MPEFQPSSPARGLDLSPEWTLEEVVHRYPLSLEFFHAMDLPGKTQRNRWKTQLQELADDQNVTLNQLETNLQDHLERSVRPDSRECKTNICLLLLFCPEKIKDALIRRISGWIPFVKGEEP